MYIQVHHLWPLRHSLVFTGTEFSLKTIRYEEESVCMRMLWYALNLQYTIHSWCETKTAISKVLFVRCQGKPKRMRFNAMGILAKSHSLPKAEAFRYYNK